MGYNMRLNTLKIERRSSLKSGVNLLILIDNMPYSMETQGFDKVSMERSHPFELLEDRKGLSRAVHSFLPSYSEKPFLTA
jgi:hypothetical protein